MLNTQQNIYAHTRLGWPIVKRREYFRKCLEENISKRSVEIMFQGKKQLYAVAAVPIGMPKYRLSNGRTASLQQEYLAQNLHHPADFFKTDPELITVQEVQHELLLKVVEQEGLLKYFSDARNQQTEHIILDANGFVINGNRRLTAWRKLFYEDLHNYDHLSHIDAIMLPHCDEKDLDKLEASLQIHRDIKAAYSWDTTANMMVQKMQEHGLSVDEIADIYDMKKPEVEELLDMRNYADEYLRSREKENRWSLVSKNEFAFRKIFESRRKMSALPGGKQELFKQAAFVLIDADEKEGRLYESIPGVYQYLDQVEEKLKAYFKVEPPKDDPRIGDLFGTKLKDDISGPLALEIRKDGNNKAAREIIIEVIQAQKELKKEAKNAEYLVKKIANANADLQSAIQDGLKPDSSTKGVEEQLNALEAKVERIRNWLKKNVDNSVPR
jgi:hypothetical protein